MPVYVVPQILQHTCPQDVCHIALGAPASPITILSFQTPTGFASLLPCSASPCFPSALYSSSRPCLKSLKARLATFTQHPTMSVKADGSATHDSSSNRGAPMRRKQPNSYSSTSASQVTVSTRLTLQLWALFHFRRSPAESLSFLTSSRVIDSGCTAIVIFHSTDTQCVGSASSQGKKLDARGI